MPELDCRCTSCGTKFLADTESNPALLCSFCVMNTAPPVRCASCGCLAHEKTPVAAGGKKPSEDEKSGPSTCHWCRAAREHQEEHAGGAFRRFFML